MPHAVYKWGAPVVFVGATTWLRLLSGPLLGPEPPSLLFILPVIASAWIGGLGSGLLATALSVLAGSWVFGRHLDSVFAADADYGLRLAIFALESALIAIVIDRLHRSVRREQGRADALRLQEERLRVITDAVPALISYVDSRERYQFVNKAYEEWFGQTRDSMAGLHLRDVLGEDAYQAIQPQVAMALAGTPIEFERPLQYKNGRTRIVRASYVPNVSADGRVHGYFALVVDVTETRKAELAAREASERFSLMADHAPTLIWISDPSQDFIWLNQPWLQFTGRTMAEEVGRGWTENVHAGDLVRWDETYSAAAGERKPFAIEYRLRRHDDTYRWLLAHGVPRVEGGEFVGYIGSCIDITERKVAEEQREHARLAAETANRIKDEFLATLSHELRTPLNAIVGWTRMLRTIPLSEAAAARGLEVIERNAHVQTQLVEDILDVSRIISGKLRLQIRSVTLADVVESAVEVVRPAADAKGVRLEVLLDAKAARVLGDPDRLQQVVWNLLSNAVKFTSRDGLVELRLQQAGSTVEIAVRDTGVGIPPEFLPHVFERFRQADSRSSREYGGLGLGLAIVRSLIELHGGIVQASSLGLGQGATFIVRLPVAAPQSAADDEMSLRVPARGSRTGADGIRLDGISVLVVDDDGEALELLETALTNAGAQVRSAASAAAALEQLDRDRCDVLVSDIGMPGADGYDLIRAVRERQDSSGRIPAIALTAYARSDDRLRAIRAGFQLHVTKPIDPDELLGIVATVVGRGDSVPQKQA